MSGNGDEATLAEALDPANGDACCCTFHRTGYALLRAEVERLTKDLDAVKSERDAAREALRGVRTLAYEWTTCDAVEMEDGDLVGPSPSIAKTLRHCAGGVFAALEPARAALAGKGGTDNG